MGKKQRARKARARANKKKKKQTPTRQEWQNIYEMGLQKAIRDQVLEDPQKELQKWLDDNVNRNSVHNATFNFIRELQSRFPNKFPQNNVRKIGMVVGSKKATLQEVVIEDIKAWAKKELNASLVKGYVYVRGGKEIKINDFVRLPFSKEEDKKLIELTMKNKSNEEIAKELNRNTKSISMRKYRLKKKGDLK